jgi:O-antigen ligase
LSINIDSTDEWKYQGAKGMPKNSKNETVDTSTYFRITWFIAGIDLLKENPLGYGLLTTSFDKLSKQKWPDSLLGLTHSGWLDFSLGYGILGFFLMAYAFVRAWLYGFKLDDPWRTFVIYGFLTIGVTFFFKEISYEIVVNGLIFLIVFVSSYSAAFLSHHLNNK